MPQRAPWWSRPWRAYQSNIREIDAGLDVDAIIAHMRSIGADAWLLNAGGIVSFYPSDLEYQHRSPWLAERASGDLIGDAVEAAHAAGIRLIGRFDFAKVDLEIGLRHPEWLFRDRNGNSPVYNGLVSTCPSGPYYQERLFDILTEALDRYSLDGVFFNWFHFTEHDYSLHPYDICRCDSCVAGFRDFAGSALPAERDWNDPAYLEWKRYIAHVMSALSTRIRRFIADRDPGIALSLRQDADIAFSESGTGVYLSAPFWIHGAGDDVLRYRTERPERPVWLTLGVFADMTYRFEIEQQDFLGLQAAQTIAYGGNPCVYQIGIPATIPAGSFDAMGAVLRFHRDHAEHYTDAVPAARVAVVSSADTERRLGVPDGIDRGRSERRGITKALREGHLPFDLLPETSIGDGRLARYDVVVLPNVISLSEADAAVLDEYVAAGGGLVVTGEPGLGDPVTGEGDEFALASLPASRVLRRLTAEKDVRGSYLRVLPGDEVPGFGAAVLGRELLMLDRRFAEVEPHPDAVSAMRLIPPAPYGPPEKIHWSPEHETEVSGLLWREHGRGRVAYLPWLPGALFHDLGLPGHRDVICRAVVAAARGVRQLESNTSPYVEFTVMCRPDGETVLHAVNYTGHHGREFTAPATLADLEVELLVDVTPAEVRSLALGQDLPFTIHPTESGDGKTVRFRLPELGLLDAIVIR
ncbi:alpha-amylase family protein [Kribbella sp. NPDC049227]|uniref:alpha-amylase family protein n=1 Tax=Kribbella sp. NPDC049227 TaxID=3364113 RepID=UPI003712288C